MIILVFRNSLVQSFERAFIIVVTIIAFTIASFRFAFKLHLDLLLV